MLRSDIFEIGGVAEEGFSFQVFNDVIDMEGFYSKFLFKFFDEVFQFFDVFRNAFDEVVITIINAIRRVNVFVM